MITLPDPKLPDLIRLRLLAEQAELALLRLAVQDGLSPAVAVALYIPPDQRRTP